MNHVTVQHSSWSRINDDRDHFSVLTLLCLLRLFCCSAFFQASPDCAGISTPSTSMYFTTSIYHDILQFGCVYRVRGFLFFLRNIPWNREQGVPGSMFHVPCLPFLPVSRPAVFDWSLLIVFSWFVALGFRSGLCFLAISAGLFS